ncbi:hypothetical protein D3C81_2329800 [compost metagenome]
MDASFNSIVGDQIDVGAGPDWRVDHDRLDPRLRVGDREAGGQEEVGRHNAKIFKVEVV